jgi:F-type H+-transporting ATPase subunit b
MISRTKVLRGFALALLLAGGATIAVPAYSQSAAADQDKRSSDRRSGDPAQATVEQQPAPAQETKSQEAKGEEETDQTEQFKHSHSVRLIGRIIGLDSQRSYWIAEFINFGVVAAILVWAGRKMLPGFFRSRTESIQKAMQEAQKASAEARARLSDIESRLSKLDSEIASMRETAQKEAAAEEQRIKAATEEEARKIISGAEQEIAAAVKAARRQLTVHAADLAVGLAQKQIHVDAPTDQALVRNFAGQLGESAESAGWQGDRKDSN